jgi:hypothetical protein
MQVDARYVPRGKVHGKELTQHRLNESIHKLWSKKEHLVQEKETLLQSKKVHSAKLMKMKAAVNKILLLESYISEKSSISHQELRMTEQRLSELYQKQCSLRNSLSAEHSLSKTDRMISVVTKLLLEWNALVLEISTVLKSQLEGVSTRLGTKLQSSDTLAPGSSMAPNIYFLDEAKSEQRCTDLQAKLQALKDKKNSLEGIIKSLSLDGEPSAKAKEQKFRALEALAEQNSEPKLKVIHKSISLKNTKENHSLAKHEHTKQAKALTAQLISATEATLEVKTFYSRLSTVALPDVAEKEARLRESIVKQEAVQQFLFAVLNDEFDVSNDNIKTDDACKQLHSISKRLLEEKKCNSLAGKLRNATKVRHSFVKRTMQMCETFLGDHIMRRTRLISDDICKNLLRAIKGFQKSSKHLQVKTNELCTSNESLKGIGRSIVEKLTKPQEQPTIARQKNASKIKIQQVNRVKTKRKGKTKDSKKSNSSAADQMWNFEL